MIYSLGDESGPSQSQQHRRRLHAIVTTAPVAADDEIQRINQRPLLGLNVGGGGRPLLPSRTFISGRRDDVSDLCRPLIAIRRVFPKGGSLIHARRGISLLAPQIIAPEQ